METEKKESRVVVLNESDFTTEIRRQPDGSGVVVRKKVKKGKYVPHQSSREKERRLKRG